MELLTRSFNRKQELVDWVNEHGITKDQIVDIFQDNEKLFVLMYFGEGK